MEPFALPDHLRALAEKHFVLLHAENTERKRDSLRLNLSGYADVANLTADIVKVCLLALDNEAGHPHVPEPHLNISGVLSTVLDLIPYEEYELLDRIRHSMLTPREEDWDFILETVRVTPRWALEKGNAYIHGKNDVAD